MKTWRERVVAAKKRGTFTPKDFGDAGDYSTCAVGEQHHTHPLVVLFMPKIKAPRDMKLYELGMAFYWDGVCRHDPGEADRILDLIEDRVLELKRITPTIS